MEGIQVSECMDQEDNSMDVEAYLNAYEQMSSLELKAIVDKREYPRSLTEKLLKICMRKLNEKKAIITQKENNPPVSFHNVLKGEERKKTFSEWSKLCKNKPYDAQKEVKDLSLPLGTPIYKISGKHNDAIVYEALKKEDSKKDLHQIYGVPLRTLDVTSGERFRKTGKYVVDVSAFKKVKDSAHKNLTDVKARLLGTKTKKSMCEHIENFEQGEYYNYTEAIPLNLFGDSKVAADQIRFFLRRTKPCVGARKSLLTIQIREKFTEDVNAKWEKFLSAAANLPNCVPPDKRMWGKESNGRKKKRSDRSDSICTCELCGPEGHDFRRPSELKKHMHGTKYSELIAAKK